MLVRPNIVRWTAIAASMLLLITAGWWAMRQQSVLDMAPVAMEKSADQQYAPASDDALAAEATTTEKEEEVVYEPTAPSSPIAGVQDTAPAKEESAATTPPPASNAAEALAAANAAKDRMEQEEKKRATDLSSRKMDSEAIARQARDAVEADELTVAPSPPAPAASPTYPAQNQAYSRSLDDPTRMSNSGVPVPATGYRIIEGYVTDAEGFPLIGASVMTPGKANGTVTDLDGFYRITVAKQVKTLSVSYTGFESTQVNIDNKDRLDVAMAEGMALDEVVVTGLGAQRRQATTSSVGIAQPSGGFNALRDYIVSKTPVNTPRARIKVRFLVQANGRLTDFTILRSTNTGQNSLAIQLLKEGPAWEITEGNAPVEAVYVVKF
jgi:hypothetical protein